MIGSPPGRQPSPWPLTPTCAVPPVCRVLAPRRTGYPVRTEFQINHRIRWLIWNSIVRLLPM